MAERKISLTQIKQIHIGTHHLSREIYLSILSGYDVQTSKNLTFAQADDLIRKLIKDGLLTVKKKSDNKKVNQYGWGKNKYECLRGRDDKFADPKQLRMIEAMWKQNSEAGTDQALAKFIDRITGRDDITFLLKADVEKVVQAIKNLK